MSSSSFDMKEAVKQAIPNLDVNDVFIERLCKIASVYSYNDAKDLACELDAYMIENSENEKNVHSSNLLGKFEQYIKMHHNKQSTPGPASKVKSKIEMNNKHTPSSINNNKRSSDSISPSVSSTIESTSDTNTPNNIHNKDYKSEFDKRTDALRLICTWNGPSIPSDSSQSERGEWIRSDSEPLGVRCKITSSKDDIMNNVPGRYRYMYTPLEERATNLDSNLKRLEDYMADKAGIGDIHANGVPSQDEVWVCGRVRNEASEGKLNKTSVEMEGSRIGSHGRKCTLDLKDAPSYALFPGQVVLAKGINANGRRFMAKELIEGIPRPMPVSKASDLLEFHHSTFYQDGKALSVSVVSGPFTTSEDLSFKPMEDLIIRIRETNPDVVIMIGPFVDITHPLMKDGDVEIPDDEGNVTSYSYEQAFMKKFSYDFFDWIYGTDEDYDPDFPTNFILVPSLDDAHHDRVYPQPPMGDHEEIKSPLFDESQPLGVLKIPNSDNSNSRCRVHCMPNPCMFKINEVVFGVSSVDTLFSLSSDEISENVPGDRLDRLAAHFIRQQSFYPMFPVPTNSSVPLDLRHLNKLNMEVTPDVLILPSKLKQFAKEIQGSMVINPGHLTRGNKGGTFAEMHIHPMSRDILENNSNAMDVDSSSSSSSNSSNGDSNIVEHRVASRTKVIVRKI